ncbi:MAG: hypothetical protein Q8O57_01110 [Kiritimatiellota bacterium]|nr:hypothetical protein [Kiritimatiellota bacterium]
MAIKRLTVALTTDTNGAATGYTSVFSGRVSQIRYVKPVSGGFSDGVDFTITLEATGETVWAEDNVNASATRAPRQATHSTAGVAALFAGSGTAVNDKIVAAADRVKIVVASGGSVTTGTFHVTVE